MIDEDPRVALAARYRRFADVECYEDSPQYARLARAVAEDETLLRFIAALPDGQPNLFLASVQYVSGAADMPVDGAELNTFVEAHAGEIALVMRARRTQTNEVGRCAALLPALPVGGPLALIEVGASAGLCLLLDRFSYDYGGVRLENQSASVVLKCASEKRPIVWVSNAGAGAIRSLDGWRPSGTGCGFASGEDGGGRPGRA